MTTTLYVPPTEESDHKKQNMSLQLIAKQTCTNTDTLASLVLGPGAYLPLTGGTVTGDVTVAKADPVLTINKAASGQYNLLQGSTNGVRRWNISPGDNTAEAGANSGSDFSVYRYTDAGGLIDAPLSIERATGTTTLTGDVTVANADPVLTINKSASGQYNLLQGSTGGVRRWNVSPGDANAEAGANSGSDFSIYRYDDAGSLLNSPLSIVRSTGIATFTASPLAPTPTSGDSTTKLATTAHVMARTSISVSDFGAVANGSITVSGTGTDARAAFVSAAAFASASRVVVPSGNYRIAANLTVPAGIEWEFLPGAAICPDTGVTVTIGDIVHAGRYRIFGNNGTVQGIRSVQPEWWGAVGDGATNDKAALQAAHDCVEQSKTSRGGEQVVLLGGANYGIGSVWTIRPTCDNNIRIRGVGTIFGGSRITALSSFSGTAAVTVASPVSTSLGSLAPIADWGLYDFAVIHAASSPATVGLYIGSTSSGDSIHGLQQNHVSGVNISDFATGIEIQGNVRLIKFTRCSVWGNNATTTAVCLLLTTAAGSTFTGDLSFDNCQFVMEQNTNTKNVQFYLPDSGSSVTGSRFTECIFYHADIGLEINVNAGATVADHWFTNNQFDGCARGIDAYSIGAAGYIHDIFVQSNYFQGHSNKGVLFSSSSSGFVKDITFTGNRMNGVTGPAMEFTTVMNVVCSSNVFNALNYAGPALSFTHCTSVVFNGNVFGRAPATSGGALPAQSQYMLGVLGTTDYLISTGNIAYNGATTAYQINTASGTHNKTSNDWYV